MTTPETKEINLSMLYAKAAKRQDMDFQECCKYVHTLNKEQHQIVMYNRAWCNSYINAQRHGEKQEGYRMFLSGLGDREKSHCTSHTKRYVQFFQTHSKT